MPLTLIVSAYKEENILRQKIENILQLSYPRHLLQVIFVIDEPDPADVDLLKDYPWITLILESERKGKYAAIKKAMARVKTPIVVFSDANSQLNPEALEKMVGHYTDNKVGAVAGEKKILYQQEHSAVGQAEGWYWRYESFMKKLDAGFYTVIGAAGELFSIRTGLFQPLQDTVILDDLVISLQVCMQGYKIAYEPGAFAAELPSVSLKEEEQRKIRIAAGAFQSLHLLSSLFNPFKHPLLFFQFISRRFFRWVLGPLALFLLLLTNIYIVSLPLQSGIFLWFLYTQLFLYFLAFWGYVLIRSGRPAGICNIPFYFLFMNYCLFKGFFRFTRGSQTVLWQKVVRREAA